MTFPSHFQMPGAFHADGVHPGLFRPPVSPSSSTDYLSSSAFATDASSKQKWSGSNVPRVHDPAPSEALFDGDAFMSGASDSRPASRAYALAGQLDAATAGPAALDEPEMLGESMFSDSDYRRALGSKRTRDDMDSASSGPTQLFHLPPKPAPAGGWGSLAFATIGGVVGRVWEFCRTGAFRGFYAGGGETFKMTPEGEVSQAGHMAAHSPDETYYFHGQQSPSGNEYQFGGGEHVPGRFPHGGQYFSSEMADETPCGSGASTPTGPAAKRRHTDHFNELGRNWVMIREPAAAATNKIPRRTSGSYRASPRNRNQGPTMTTGRRIPTPINRQPTSINTNTNINTAVVPAPSLTSIANSISNSTPRRPASRATSRPASRLSDVSSLKLARPASAASFASFGGTNSPSPSRIPVKIASTASAASVASPASASTTYAAQPQRRRRNSAAPSPPSPPARRGHRRTNSAASTASSRGNELDDSPRLDAEAKHLAARRKMEERDTDVRMAAFNKRLQDMIRQGKEALGTTIEVDVTEVGWEDDA